MIYAVNKRTKEHRQVDGRAKLVWQDWYFQEADSDGWIEWHGGECPLPEEHLCDVKHRDGETFFRARSALPGRAEHWDHWWCDGDIIAYRPILDDPLKPAEKVVSTTQCRCVPTPSAEWRGEGTIPCREGDPVGRVGEPPAWDGEGEKPPVGARCMKGYEKVLILAHANVGSPAGEAVVYQSIEEPSDIDWAVCNVFSPIRSEEDRAVAKLERIIGNAVDVAYEDCHEAGRDIYRAISVGLVPGVKLVDS